MPGAFGTDVLCLYFPPRLGTSIVAADILPAVGYYESSVVAFDNVPLSMGVGYQFNPIFTGAMDYGECSSTVWAPQAPIPLNEPPMEWTTKSIFRDA